jgi:speckle-type POZ protein
VLHHLLHVRYALARGLGPGTCLRSDAFEAGGQAFQLEVFPAGHAADCSQHLSLFLTSPGADSPSHVLYELAVVDQVRYSIAHSS